MWSESDGEREHEMMSTSSSNSEVVRMEQRAVACAPDPGLQPANLQFIKSKGIHVGDQFVSVTQTVHNNEVVKGRFLGLELVSAKTTRKLRCSIAVFVCWALVVASGLAFFIFHYALAKKMPLDLDIHEPWYLRRGDWQAMPPYGRDFLNLPIKYVIIGHSASDYCTEKYACIKRILAIQSDHMRRAWNDIGPNFLVTGNGIVFEGRGADVFPAMVTAWNRRSIMIMFMGDYRYNATNIVQFDHVKVLLAELVTKQVLVPEYTVWAQCQVSPQTISPGPKIMSRMNLFTHWNPTNQNLPLPRYIWKVLKNTSKTERLSCAAALAALVICVALIVYFTSVAKANADDFTDIAPHEWNITRDMWLAQSANNTLKTAPYEPLRLVIVQHTVSTPCDRFVICAAELRTLQSYFLRNYDYDIPYNFMIGNDGRVYEGRGWGMVGAHTLGYNSCGLGLGFLGDYREELPAHSIVTALQMERTRMMLVEGVARGILHHDFKIVGAKDLRDSDSPGSSLYNAIRQWPNYDHDRIFRGKTCDQIHAMYQD